MDVYELKAGSKVTLFVVLGSRDFGNPVGEMNHGHVPLVGRTAVKTWRVEHETFLSGASSSFVLNCDLFSLNLLFDYQSALQGRSQTSPA